MFNSVGPFAVRRDDKGRVIPSLEAIRMVEREHAEKSDAEKFRFAQAQDLIWEVGPRGAGGKSATRGPRANTHRRE